jgi:5'-3' exonuclease
MYVHLIDGTYELFRAFYGAPSVRTSQGREVGATRTLLRSFAAFLREPGVTHVAAAFDTVIESFRNQLFVGYKTGEGIDPALWAQFELAERATRALGIVTWSMVEFEADDALAAFAARAVLDPAVTQVRICSPDKDLCQCVQGERVVLYDRKKQLVTDEAGVVRRLGVAPGLVPAYLALVGDTADGIPGVPRWGEKSAARVLTHYGSLQAIPRAQPWDVSIRGGEALRLELARASDEVELYQTLATLRLDVPLAESLADLAWQGPRRDELRALCEELEAPQLLPSLTGPALTKPS